MRFFQHIFVILLILLLPARVRAQDAKSVYDRVAPSIVTLDNPETSGTGIIIRQNGLILTNAHVVLSPLKYHVRLDARNIGGEKKTYTYKKVKILGTHPTYDLALVQIDPSEHNVNLKPVEISRTRAQPGQKVYAIGNPVAGGKILKKTITEGMLSGGIRKINEKNYYQFSAQVNQGNSGGPLCDRNGEVIGLVTYRIKGKQGLGFAIPLHKIKRDSFIPFHQRKANPNRVRTILKKADQFATKSTKIERRAGRDTKRAKKYSLLAMYLYRKALVYRPNDPNLYYNLGMFYRDFEKYDISIPYLIRAIEIDPWGVERGSSYRELSFALRKKKRDGASLVALKEGVRKYPKKGGKMWEDLSIYHSNHGNYSESAYCAKVGLNAGDVRSKMLKDLYQEIRSKLNEEKKNELDNRIDQISQRLTEMKKKARRARKQDKKFMTDKFRTFYKDYISDGHLSSVADAGLKKGKEEQTSGESRSNKEEQPIEDAQEEDEDKVAQKIKSKIALAKSYYESGMKDKGIKILEKVITLYPDHRRTNVARNLKKKWKTSLDRQ